MCEKNYGNLWSGRSTFAGAGVPTSGVLSVVGATAVADIPAVFSIHAGVGVSVVARVLLLLTFLLFLVFSTLLASLVLLAPLLWLASLLLLSFILMLVNCCCWGSAVVDIPFVPGAPPPLLAYFLLLASVFAGLTVHGSVDV